MKRPEMNVNVLMPFEKLVPRRRSRQQGIELDAESGLEDILFGQPPRKCQFLLLEHCVNFGVQRMLHRDQDKTPEALPYGIVTRRVTLYKQRLVASMTLINVQITNSSNVNRQMIENTSGPSCLLAVKKVLKGKLFVNSIALGIFLLRKCGAQKQHCWLINLLSKFSSNSSRIGGNEFFNFYSTSPTILEKNRK